MGEIEMMQRIETLENEIKVLKGQKFENMKQLAVDAIYKKYPDLYSDDSYELLLESACLHVQVTDTDTQNEVNSKVEEELKAVCKKAGKDEPTAGSRVIASYMEKMRQKAQDDRTYQKQVEESFVK